mgnify:CR=1 FL=1
MNFKEEVHKLQIGILYGHQYLDDPEGVVI